MTTSEKQKLAQRQWLEKNKERRKQYEREYYLKNIEKFKAISQTVEFKERKRKSKLARKKNDPIYKMRNNISHAIWKALTKGKSSKAGSSITQYLDYTIIDLKNHLEKQFDSKMTWENYGSYWHLDHIVPQSDLPYKSMEEINFKLCWSLTNLRPLEKKLNIIEGARRTRHKKT